MIYYTDRRASWRWLLLFASSPTKSLYLLHISSRLLISSSTVAIWFKSMSLHSLSMPTIQAKPVFFLSKGKLEIEKEKTRRLMKNLIEGKWRRVRGRKTVSSTDNIQFQTSMESHEHSFVFINKHKKLAKLCPKLFCRCNIDKRRRLIG